MIGESGNTVRVNRDLLRKMLHCDKFTGKNESVTVEVEKDIASLQLSLNRNVIVDDCNLNPKNQEMWNKVATDFGAKFEVMEVNTPVDVCVQRDAIRTESVGHSVIMNMALQYGLIPKPIKGYVLCDLDGTLCNLDHRLKFVNDKTVDKNWKAFFDGISDDTIYEETKQKLVSYKEDGYEIIFVSARPEDYRQVTEKWITAHGLIQTLGFWKTLIMRPSGDRRDDVEVKRDILNKYFKDRNTIHTVIDDRPRVIRMWREEGLNVIDVGKQIEF